jgi:DNA-binding PadR family transcriptional regulator
MGNYLALQDSFRYVGLSLSVSPAVRISSPLSPPVFHVLLALGEDALHGYAIMQRFEAITGGADQLLPGTLYVTLARMVEQGLIEATRAPAGHQSGGAPRRYYRLTTRGRAAGRAESERLRRLVQVAEERSWLPGIAR